MSDTMTRATTADFDAIWQLYKDVCENQKNDQYGPDWTLGVYPTTSDIKTHLEAEELYVLWEDEVALAAMAVVPHEDPEYVNVPWPTRCLPDEVAVIHLIAVHPQARGRGLGLQMVQQAIRLAREEGKRVIHLDVIPGNLAASRIYLQAGFGLVGTFKIFYEDTGLADFEMYECVL